MSGSDYERKLNNILEEEYGWLSVRSAGSMGKCDLVAIHPDHDNSPIVIEAKKSGKNKYYCSYDPEQFEMMVGHASRGINTVYAIRYTSENNGDKWDSKWEVYWLDGNEEDPAIFRRGEGDTLDETFLP